MDNALKQRVLGVIVLFALIGICITVLLHNNKVAQQQSIQRAQHLIAASEKTPEVSAAPTLAEPIPHHHRVISPLITAPITHPTTTTTATPPIPATAKTTTSPITEAPSNEAINNELIASASSTTQHKLTHQKSPNLPSAFQATHTKTKTATTDTVATTTAPSFTSTQNFTPTKAESTKTAKSEKIESTKLFAVQVGTFSKRENATALAKALHGRGFSATTQTIKTKHGFMTRVLVGQKGLTRKEAETTKLHLSQTLHLKGIISPVGVEKKTKTTHTATSHTRTIHEKKTVKKASSEKVSSENTVSKNTVSEKTTPENGAPVTEAKPSYAHNINNHHASSSDINSSNTRSNNMTSTTSDNTAANNSGAVVIP